MPNDTPWLPYQRRANHRSTRLLCFPPAGAGATFFHAWRRYSAEATVPALDVQPVELPGRGSRFSEPAHTSLEKIVEQLTDAAESLCRAPYALFGHSLGAIIAYRFACSVSERGVPAPVCIFVSGASPHGALHRKERFANAPDAVLVERMRSLGGTVPELLESDEMMEMFLPLMRADLQCFETYVPPAAPPLSIPMVFWGGQDDVDVPPVEADNWRRLTRARFESAVFSGGHFYLSSRMNELYEAIASRVASDLSSVG